MGRCRIAPLPDASAPSLHAFIVKNVQPGSTVITDGWPSYCGIDKLDYVHVPRSQRAASARGDDPHELLPAVHRVASLVKRWLLGTHQGSFDGAHLPTCPPAHLPTCPATLMSSSSGSIGAGPQAGGWCSTGFSNSRLGTSP